MNGEIEVLKTNNVIFPMEPRNQEVSDAKPIKIEETIVTEIQTIGMQERFVRLKKSLRKRSRSIL